MSIAFYVTDNDSNVIPIANGDFFTANMLVQSKSASKQTSQQIIFETGTFTIEFFEDADGLIPATATGTIQPRGKIDQNSFAAPGSGDASIDAAAVVYDEIAYNVPVFNGPMHQGRIRLAGMGGDASFFRATFWRNA